MRSVLIERSRFKALLAGDEEVLARQATSPDMQWLAACVIAVVLSCGVYGATFGLWLSGVQGLYTGIKLPTVILLTCLGNAGLNGCLALVLGAGIGFRQSSVAVLMSFTIMGLVLVSFAPPMLFLIGNVPGPGEAGAAFGQKLVLLAHVVVIAFAGIVGNCRLWQTLRRITGEGKRAHLVLFSWLAGNLLLGSQISWILRPWVATSGGGVSFFSTEPMRGNFFEAVWHALRYVLFNQ